MFSFRVSFYYEVLCHKQKPLAWRTGCRRPDGCRKAMQGAVATDMEKEVGPRAIKVGMEPQDLLLIRRRWQVFRESVKGLVMPPGMFGEGQV